MVTWEQFKEEIRQWVRLLISDDEFYRWLTESTFECEADQRVADVFLKQHDEGYWSASYHHVR